jgi:hypothetical protein
MILPTTSRIHGDARTILDRPCASRRETEMTTRTDNAPATPATRPPDRFEQEVHEKGYLDEADVT